MQVLNVVLGGDLHVHLPDVVGDRVTHRSSQTEAASHAVRVAAGSHLAGALGVQELPAVPSWHHQGLSRLGSGLRVVAWAPDDVVEAVELGSEAQLVAVQWHPELASAAAPGRPLFEGLVAGAQRRRQGRR
jgi:putative glutamine amidotransferase